MNYTFLLVLVLALSREPGPLGEPLQISERLWAIIAGVGCVYFFAKWISDRTVERLDADFHQRAYILRHYVWWRWAHTILGLAVYAIVLELVGWSSIVRVEWRLRDSLLIDEILLLAPYLIAEILSLNAFFAVDLAIRQRLFEDGQLTHGGWTRWGYLNFQIRNQMGLWLATSLGVSVLTDGLTMLDPGWKEDAFLSSGLVIVVAICLVLFSPWLIRLMFQAAPVPDGPLRRQLSNLGDRLGFGYSDILIWRTGGGMANAAVTGIVPQLRYVLLSDSLLDELSVEEIQAVFGHEIGHVKHHHLAYYFFFMLTSISAIVYLCPHLREWLDANARADIRRCLETAFAYVDLELWILLPYFGVAFGFLSRRFERQADLFGSRAASQALRMSAGDFEAGGEPSAPTPEPRGRRVSPSNLPLSPAGVQVFIHSLEKVAFINGISRTMRSWRHGSVAQRIEFLEQVRDDPAIADRFERWLTALRWLVGLALALSIAALAQR